MKEQTKNGGISIRVIHAAMLLCAAAIIAILAIMSIQSADVFNRLSRETGNYIVRQKAAHELLEASDYLTENVQRFTQDGDRKYMDNYFTEAFTSKRREAAITMMSESEAEQNLIEQLQAALSESQALMYREYYAMKLVTEAQQTTDVPDTIRAIELKEEDVFRSAEEKMELAQDMVMGNEYYASKEIIRANLKNTLDTLDEMMGKTRSDTAAELTRRLSLLRIATIVLTVIILALIALSAWLGTIPLIQAAKAAKAGEPVPVTGSKEFRYMAEHYNRLHDAVQGKTDDPD